MKLRNMASVYILHDGKILLLYREGSRIAHHLYTASAGGHFEPAELNDPHACMARELKEELGLSTADFSTLSLRYITLRSRNGEIRQNYYYFAEIHPPDRIQTSTEGTLSWVSLTDALSYPMPHSARGVIAHYLTCGQYNSLLYCGVSLSGGTVFHPLYDYPDPVPPASPLSPSAPDAKRQ